ncbi:MAG: AAA family ATPase [Nitrospira sp.]|nr:AAA family ATPase [Nitrospira sp.]
MASLFTVDSRSSSIIACSPISKDIIQNNNKAIAETMITSIEVENVRLFEGKGWQFPLCPITVFCGTNSSGKSTLLKVLLLLKQSIVVQDSTDSPQGRLVFYSNQIDLGSYQSFVTNNERDREIALTIRVEDSTSLSFVNSLRLIKGQKELDGARGHKVPSLPYILTCSFTFGLKRKVRSGSTPVATDETKGSEANDGENSIYTSQSFLKTATFSMSYDNEELLSWQLMSSLAAPGAESNTERYELILPRKYADTVMSKYGLGLIGLESTTKDASDFTRYEATLRGVLPHVLRAKWIGFKKQKGTSRTKETLTKQPLLDWPLPPHLSNILADLHRALAKIHYLGPFRAPAKRYYIAHVDANPDLDPTGEFLPYVLQQQSNANVLGVLLKNKDSSEKETLEQALNYWVHYLRTGHKIESTAAPKEIALLTSKDVLVELMVKTPSGDKSYALTDSGFGYSQVLPILVRGLLAEAGSTLIVEQPELHLNPALQVRLADFFVHMMRSGKQVLLETHSEHLVNAIRILVAEDETNEISSKAGVIFMDVEQGTPSVKQLDILPDGTIPDWPPTFFGEAISLSSRLLRAQGRFRNKTPKQA